MDIELLKKYNLVEAQKRFQQINEYTLLGDQKLNEIGEEDDQQQQGMQQPMGGGQDMQQGQQPGADMGGQMPQQGADPNMGGDPNMMGGQGGDMQQPMDAQGGMQGDPNAMGMDAGMGADPSMGGDPGMGMEQDPMAGGDPNTDTMQPDDEVIDVDDLTQAQETTEIKLDGVDEKLTQLVSIFDKFENAISQTDEKLEALKAEIEKRNPTDVEKMNIRSQASYPYSEFPRDYWDKKAAENPHYDVVYNNDVSPSDEQEFMLKSSDIKGIDDREMQKSFDLPLKLKDVLDF
jgi:hypothetical protein